MPRHRRALTLIELLVVFAAIGILIALLVPAVQRVRNTAAHAECTNQLRQIGLAAHHFHDANKMFPAGQRFQLDNGDLDPCQLMSWLTQLLPYIDQEPLWQTTLSAYEQSPSPFVNPPHSGLAAFMPLFVCPADPRLRAPQIAVQHNLLVGCTSYLGISGLNLTTFDGVLFQDSWIRIGDITDGTSNTLFAGERPPSPDFEFGWWYAGEGQIYSGSLDMVLGVQEQNQVPNSSCPVGFYPFTSGDLSNPCDVFHFWSLHGGGANFLLADGSVHFLSYSSASILPALASRAGNETVMLP